MGAPDEDRRGSITPLRATPVTLEVEGVGVRVGARWIVRDVSFDARPGEITAIIGPNGAGKTTLLSRTIIDTFRGVTATSRAWHTLAVELRALELTVLLDGEKKFHKMLDMRPAGRIGLWSKADSQVLFDDFAVTPL